MTKIVHDEESDNVIDDVYLSTTTHKVSPPNDPFAQPYQELNLVGLDKGFKADANRRMKKATAANLSINSRHPDSKLTGGGKAMEPEALLGYNYLECITPPKNLEDLAKLYDISAPNHAAINAKVDNIVGLGYDWVESPVTRKAKEKTNSDRRKTTLLNMLAEKKIWLEEWLDSLNKIDTFDETLRKLWRDYESTGNAYLEIARTRDGRVKYVGHVSSVYMRIRSRRDGFVQIIGNEVVFFKNFKDDAPNLVTDDPNPNEMIHFKKYSPTSSYYGVPDILPALDALAGNEFASKYNLDYFENKAIPRYAIICEGSKLSANSIRRLVEFFETGLRTKNHRSVFIPVPQGTSIKFEAIETKAQDLSFKEYSQANNKEIFMAHRTPMSRAGILPDSGGLAAARDADKIFKESVCRPEQAILEKRLNQIFYDPVFNNAYKFKLRELSLTDEDQQSQIDERYVRMQIKVPDEIRARLGEGPRPDGNGDKPWEASAQQAADANATAGKTRQRDAERSAGSSDKVGEGRNEQGAGRRVE